MWPAYMDKSNDLFYLTILIRQVLHHVYVCDWICKKKKIKNVHVW